MWKCESRIGGRPAPCEFAQRRDGGLDGLLDSVNDRAEPRPAPGTSHVPVARDPIAAVRHFSRFYTGRLEVLREGLLDSAFTLTEARVLYELANRTAPTAADLGRDLNLDAGYLSRILKRFEEQGLLRRERSARDGRQATLTLTAAGRSAFAPLDERSRLQVDALLKPLRETERAQLVAAMRKVEALSPRANSAEPPYALRPHRPGDIGWIVHRTGPFTHRNTASTRASRLSSRRSPPASSKASIRSESAAGSRRRTGKSSAPCFS